jgi:predicted HTH domain antitoxin
MTSLVLEVPQEVVQATRLPPEDIEGEFRKELAIALYQRGILSFGKARLLAQMTHWQFDELLGVRGIVRHYSESDLEEDIEYGVGRE